MRGLKLLNGDYVPDGLGGAVQTEGKEALLQRVLFRLTARRGQFPFLETMGSALYALGRVEPALRQSAAEQAVAEALADEEDLKIEQVTLSGEELTVALVYEGEELSVRVSVQ